MSLNGEQMKELIEDLDVILDRDFSNQENISILGDEINHEVGDVLLKWLISNSIDKDIEDYIFKIIFSKIKYHQVLFFYVSLKYGKVDDFLYYIKDLSSLFVHDLYLNLAYFLPLLSKKQIKNLVDLSKEYKYNNGGNNLTIDTVISKIVSYRFENLKQNLSGINIEINKDKEEIRRVVSYLGFDDKYDEFLTGLDRHFNSSKDSIEIAGLISNFRQFTCDIIIDIADQVSKLKGLNEIPRSNNPHTNSPIGHARDYLRVVFELTDHEHKFIDHFIGILHAEGGHAFLSSMEYFRLTKNIFIEIVLLLVSKLKDFKDIK